MTLGIGLIGCGLVTQHLHIPALGQLRESFSIRALHDASPDLSRQLAARIPGVTAYHDLGGLLTDPAVDAVLVAGPSALHASHAMQAMRAGKHVLIEKPMCMTTAEADGLVAVARETGVTVQIGYMRRHALAFGPALEQVKAVRGSINMARVVEVIGPNADFVGPTASLIQGGAIPPDTLAQAQAARAKALAALVGTTDGPRATAAELLLGLSTHSLSTMRGLLGMPLKVLQAHTRRDGRFLNVTFDYGDFLCQFETGVDAVPRFDAHIRICAQDRDILLAYDTPFVRNDPARLTVRTGDGQGGLTTTEFHPRREDPFTSEWRAFAKAVGDGVSAATDIEDACLDHRLIEQILAKAW